MQPADITLALRRRSPWEATDLGLAMMQRWWRPVYATHALVLGVVACPALLLGWAFDAVWLGIVAIWWLQPVYDRAALYVLSRAVFGEAPDIRVVLGAVRGWLTTGVIAALTFGRIDFARSFNLPVRQLEGQRGREARARRSVLGRRARGTAVWLTVVWVHFEAVLLWSAGAMTQLLLPAQLERQRGDEVPLLGGFFERLTAASVGDGLIFTAVWLVLEPFYVATGFALYLNRRTLLEGWDIEVALRRIAKRHATAAAVLAIAMAGFCLPAPAFAQPKDAKTEIAEILKDREFGYFRDATAWRERNSRQPRAREAGNPLEAIGYALAEALRVLVWMTVAAGIGYLLWRSRKLLPRTASPPHHRYQPPAPLSGTALAPDHLPSDIPEAAAELVRANRLREALSLLYRGALSELMHKRGVQLLPSHTEGEAVRLAGMPYFAALVELWRACAYAKRYPSAAEVDKLAAQYREAFR